MLTDNERKEILTLASKYGVRTMDLGGMRGKAEGEALLDRIAQIIERRTGDEVSDNEIYTASEKYCSDNEESHEKSFIDGAKWLRSKLTTSNPGGNVRESK